MQNHINTINGCEWECLCLCTVCVREKQDWRSSDFMLHVLASHFVCTDLMDVHSQNGHVLQQEELLQKLNG